VPGRRDLPAADDPAEAAGGDQHEADAVVQRELQRLRDAVAGRLADRLEAESVAVEREGRGAVRDRQADDDRRQGCGASGRPPRRIVNDGSQYRRVRAEDLVGLPAAG
jgi:hypothetical protein